MKAQFEYVPAAANSYLIFRRTESTFPFNWHYHPEYELTLIEKGRGQRLVSDSIEDYEPGDLVLLGPNVPHTWKSSHGEPGGTANNSAVVLQFRIEHLGHSLLELSELRPIVRLLEDANRGLHFDLKDQAPAVFAELKEILKSSPARRTLLLPLVLLTLAESGHARLLSSGRLNPAVTGGEQGRINAIFRQLNRAATGTVNYTELARQIRMDKSSLCRFFKRTTGRTMTEYVNEIRISNAVRMLIETERSALEIALSVGFSNYSNFCRHFKRIRGCSPRSLRQGFRAASAP